MNTALLLEMVTSVAPGRLGIGSRTAGMTYAELTWRAMRGAALVTAQNAQRLVFIGTNGPAFPIAFFASALAGIPLVPLNYRLSPQQLRSLVDQQPKPLVIAEPSSTAMMDRPVLHVEAWLEATTAGEVPHIAPPDDDPERIALFLYTSGTTASPKAAILRHRHLVSYILASVELLAADEASAALVSVPTYHIAGVANLLSNLYAGRRIVYLDNFTAEKWLATVRDEAVTSAMVVPTMLARIVDHVEQGADRALPDLRTISYGGARMPTTVIQRALRAFPTIEFVNAYGLTETSSTIAVLGPEDHRAAVSSADPVIRARLGSAGRVVPTVDVEIRTDDGKPLPTGESGLIWVRGEQVSGEYEGQEPGVGSNGWFPTRDRGRLDYGGYLFVEGRSDDTIIRGGENIAPAEIEDEILQHPHVADVAVVGPADDEWGQRITAVIVPVTGSSVDPGQLRSWLKARLRSSKTPDQIVVRDSLPRTETGKVLRRQLLGDLETSQTP